MLRTAVDMLKRGAYYEIQLEQGGWKTDGGMKKHKISGFIIKLIYTHQITFHLILKSGVLAVDFVPRPGLGNFAHARSFIH